MVAASHYRTLVDGQHSEIAVLCETWQRVLNDSSGIPDDICGKIQIAVGQAQLLLSQKFEQFRELIGICENGGLEKEVTVEDLSGFWELVNIQVNDIRRKFEEIEALKKNNWELPSAEEKSQRQPLGNLNKSASNLAPRRSLVVKKDFSALAKERLAQAKALARKRMEDQCCQ